MAFDRGKLREFLSSALSAEQLRDLCFDHYRSIYDAIDFSGNRKDGERKLIEYVERQGQIPQFVEFLKPLNPTKYQEYFGQVDVPEPSSPGPGSLPSPGKCDVLVLAANPLTTDALQLEHEAQRIQDRLGEGSIGKSYRVQAISDVQVSDLSRLLLEYSPTIVHFAGHGNQVGNLIFGNESNEPHAVKLDALANLFQAVKGRTECVVLNACFSFEKADVLLTQIPYVIGMESAIDDRSAVSFSAGFYRGLGFGKDYLAAFELGRNEIQLLNLPGTEVPRFTSQDVPILSRETEEEPSGTHRFFSPQIFTSRPTDNEAVLYPLWYGTNRAPNQAGDLSKGFSAERDQKLHYGTCQVAVPKSHRIGEIGSSWLKNLLTRKDDRLKLDTKSMTKDDAPSFWDNIRQTLQEHDHGQRMGLVFIHGFNVSFEAAALRAAQIGFDLQFPGITAFYSWPSQGLLTKYFADEASIQASEPYITQFLLDFVEKSGAEQVHIIAHSMGNRGLLRSIQRIIHQTPTTTQKRFGQIILAAADEDPDVFKELGANYQQIAYRTTLYVSSQDKALASSGLIHDESRVGFTPPVAIIPGVDTVEVSNIDLSLLGHGYYGDARPVLTDIHTLLREDVSNPQKESPGSRFGLREQLNAEGKKYWIISS